MRSLRENIGKLSIEDREGEKEREKERKLIFIEFLLNCVLVVLRSLFYLFFLNFRVVVLISCSRF